MTVDPALIEGLHRQLRQQLSEFTTSDEWLTWLHGARRFHRYSPNNQLLLMLQGAEGHVASYKTWQRITAVDGAVCQVRKGERGLTILAPLTVTRRMIDEASGDEVVVSAGLRGFRAVKVFHQGQLVSPPAIPDQPMPALLTGADRWQHVWTAVTAQLGDEGYPVDLHSAGPGEHWNGRTHFVDGYVEVMDHLAPPQRLKTLLHEWAHVALRHGDLALAATRELREVEAESVAYLLCRTIGLDSSSYSIPYLAGWSGGDADLAEATAQRILTATAAMVDALETKLSVDVTPDLFTAANGNPTPITPAAHPPATASPWTPATATVPTAASGHPVGLTTPTDPLIEQTPPGLRHLLARLDPADRPTLLQALGHLDDREACSIAATLCADAGFDAAQTAATLGAAGAEPVPLRRAMKHSVVDFDGRRRFLFDNIDAAFRVGPIPASLDPADADMVQRVDVDDPHQLTVTVRQLNASARYRPNEIVELLTHLGVTDADTHTAMTANGLPPTTHTQAGHHAPARDRGRVDRDRVADNQALLRRVIDDDRDPVRLAALATGLGMTYTESITACARLGLDPEFAAQVAVARRNGHIALAAADLADGWTATPPTHGWAHYLPDNTIVDPSTAGQAAAGETAARAVLAQWRQAAGSPPTPVMT